MKNIRKIIMVIIGASIGAGFASGKEIYTFFFKFGKPGLLGVIISSVITGLTIYFTLKLAYKKEIDNYDEFINEINKNERRTKNKNENKNKNEKESKSKKENKEIIINKFIKSVVIVFLLISFLVMVAGFSAYIKQVYNIENYISSTFFVLIVYFILIKSSQGMLKFNDFLVPIIIFFIIFLGVKNIPFIISKTLISENFNSFNNLNNEDNLNIILNVIKNNMWLLYSILYASFNSIVLIPIAITLRKYIEKKEDIKIVSFISTNIFIILALCIFILLLKAEFNIQQVDMPIFEVLDSNLLKFIYGLIIIFSIFTTAISVGFSFLENVSTKENYRRNLILICIVGILISNIGFSNLVGFLYPLFGGLGLVQIYYIYKNALEKKANKCYKLSNKKCGRIK